MSDALTPYEALKKAVEIAGSQSALARICGVGQPAVWKWLQSSKRVPPQYVLRIEAKTGIACHVLRPDIYPSSLVADDILHLDDCDDAVVCDRSKETQRKGAA